MNKLDKLKNRKQKQKSVALGLRFIKKRHGKNLISNPLKLYLFSTFMFLIVGCIIVPISIHYSLKKNKTSNAVHYGYDFSQLKNGEKPRLTKQVIPPFVFDNDEKSPDSLTSDEVYGSEMINKYLLLYGKSVNGAGSISMSDLAGNKLADKMDELERTAGINRQLQNALKFNKFTNSGITGTEITCSYQYYPTFEDQKNKTNGFLFVGTAASGLYVIKSSVLSKGVLNEYQGFVHVGGNQETSQIDSIASYKQNLYFTIGGHLDWINFPSIKVASSEWYNWNWDNTELTNKIQLNDEAPFYVQPSNPVIAINKNNGVMALGCDGATADPNQSVATHVVLGITQNSLSGNKNEPFLNANTMTSADWIKYPCDSNFNHTGNLPAIPPISKDLPGYGSINHISFYDDGSLYIFNSDMGFSYVNNPGAKNYQNLRFYTYLPAVKEIGNDYLQNAIWSGCTVIYNKTKWFVYGLSHGCLIAFQPFNKNNYKNIKHDIFHRSQFFSNQNRVSQQANSIRPLQLTGNVEECKYIVTTVTGLGVAIIKISDLI